MRHILVFNLVLKINIKSTNDIYNVRLKTETVVLSCFIYYNVGFKINGYKFPVKGNNAYMYNKLISTILKNV